jgi:hypothetical protein
MRAELMMDAEDRGEFEELLWSAEAVDDLAAEERDFLTLLDVLSCNPYWEPTIPEWNRLREIAAR